MNKTETLRVGVPVLDVSEIHPSSPYNLSEARRHHGYRSFIESRFTNEFGIEKQIDKLCGDFMLGVQLDGLRTFDDLVDIMFDPRRNYPRELNENFITIFGEVPDDIDSYKTYKQKSKPLWEDLAFFIFQRINRKDRFDLREDSLCIISEQPLNEFLSLAFSDTYGAAEKIAASKQAIGEKLWPIYNQYHDDIYFIDNSPDQPIFSYLVAKRLLRDKSVSPMDEIERVLDDAEDDELFTFYSLFSFLAKQLFIDATAENDDERKEQNQNRFREFMIRVSDLGFNTGAGMVIASNLIYELFNKYFPSFYQFDRYLPNHNTGTKEQESLLIETRFAVHQRYIEYVYANRKLVIGEHVWQQAIRRKETEDWPGFFEVIFSGTFGLWKLT